MSGMISLIPYRLRNKFGTIYQNLRNILLGNKHIFDDVYRRQLWPLGNNQSDGIYSGSGSLPENTAEYEAIVVDYVRGHEIRKIVDVGCGDFQVASRILEACPDGMEYVGVDASAVVIERNQRLYGSPTVSFLCRDAAKEALPEADLALCKEVLQHLSNHDVQQALERLKRFPRALITNGVHPDPIDWNIDIQSGSSARSNHQSGLWVDRPPFNLEGRELTRFHHKHLEVELIVYEWVAPK